MASLGFSTFVEHAPGSPMANEQLPIAFGAIQERTSIASRHIAHPSDTVESIAQEAIKALLHRLNIKAADCGGLVLSSSTLPHQTEDAVADAAKHIATAIGIHAPTMGVHYACSGFPASVERALALSEHSDRPIIIVWSEIMSRIVNFREEATAILFGDRAAATALIDGGHTVLDAAAWEVDDDDDLISLAPVLDALDPFGQSAARKCIRMFGKRLYMRAPGELLELVENSMTSQGIAPQDIAAVVPHQANGRFMRKIGELMQEKGWSEPYIVNEIEQMGNVGSASIPCALAHMQESLLPGKYVVCPSIGAGPCFAPGKLTEGVVTFRVAE